MRRIALVLVLAAFVVSLGGCCWNWCDPFHPRICPKLECPDGGGGGVTSPGCCP